MFAFAHKPTPRVERGPRPYQGRMLTIITISAFGSIASVFVAFPSLTVIAPTFVLLVHLSATMFDFGKRLSGSLFVVDQYDLLEDPCLIRT